MTAMTEAPSVYERDDRPREDHFVHLRGSWDDYERVLEMRGDKSAPRICFDGEVIEFMSPSKNHEGLKSRRGVDLAQGHHHHLVAG